VQHRRPSITLNDQNADTITDNRKEIRCVATFGSCQFNLVTACFRNTVGKYHSCQDSDQDAQFRKALKLFYHHHLRLHLHLLSSFKSTCYNLRSLGHGLSVSLVKSEMHKKTFINRVYLVSATDICVVLSCIWVLILCFLSSA